MGTEGTPTERQTPSVLGMAEEIYRRGDAERASGLTDFLLARFLLARIEEDEAGAHRHAAAARKGLGDGEPLVWWGRVADRVLAECEAKRRIMQELQRYEQSGAPEVEGARRGLRMAVKHLAAIYADHAGYDPDWRP